MKLLLITKWQDNQTPETSTQDK